MNYILKKDKYCEVCKSEMRAGALEDEDMDDFDEDMRLCPVCHTNYINDDETMCASCMEEKMSIGAKEEEPDWRSFVEKEASEENEEELDLLPVEENDEDKELDKTFADDLDDDFKDYDDEDDDDDDSDEFEDDLDFDETADDDFDDDDDDDDEDEEDEDDDDDDDDELDDDAPHRKKDK